MNDRPDPDHLASAYLDGELTADERALVEASPDLMRLVDAMRSVRIALRHVPVDDHHRSGAVQAALAEYDRRLSPKGSTVNGRPVSLDERRRRLQTRVLATAAAAVLVGVVGASVLGGNDGTTTPAAVSEQRDTAKQAGDAAEPMASVDAGSVDAAAADTSIAATSTIGAINQPATAALVVTDAAALLALPDPGTTDGLDSGCELGADDVVVARIIWIDTTAWAVRSTTTGAVRVLDLTCATLATATP